MNPLGPTTYHMIKLEQEHRLARLERRHRLLDGTDDEAPRAPETHRRPRLRLAHGVTRAAAATATVVLAIIAAAALAFPA